MAMVPCPKCGRLNRAGAKFCGGCGQTLGAPAPTAPQQPQQPPRPTFSPQQPVAPARPTGAVTKVMRPTSYLLIALGVIAVICIVAGLLITFAVQSGLIGNIALAQTETPTVTIKATSTVPTLVAPSTATIAPPGVTVVPTGTSVPAPTGAAPTLAPVATATSVSVIAQPPTALPSSSGKPLGDPWETDGAELNLINLDIRAGSSGSSAAVAATFAFVNKTGQRILIEIDYSKLYVEDSQNARYVDYEGAKTDSIWVDAGKRWDFTRYYSRAPQQMSRVPASTKYVSVVVEKFSRLSNVRWRYEINPVLSPIPSPPASSVKVVGQPWEQNGIQLTVTTVDVRAGQGGSSAAFGIAYKAMNRTNQRVLLEMDWSDLYVTDSFGVRFNDYEGGGYDTVWVDAGKEHQFERYYSTQANSQSRVSPGAQYVLINIRKFSRLQNAVWQYNIVR